MYTIIFKVAADIAAIVPLYLQVMYMYYLLGYRILAKPENLLTKDEVDGSHDDGGFQRVKLTDSQLRRRRRSAHFTRSVIFNYVTDEVHSQVIYLVHVLFMLCEHIAWHTAIFSA
ncbi:hypothetical protein DPMN_102946 [Dreissena polymorpha]|uniref:Uncharacterized protein n=1 Tax=Dreissena polymorpha TaxID=45954 RepID=A0A9D4H707_DREPO|nr:hypothetical protein DPMN_102946 [Dreissena polymorpha]